MRGIFSSSQASPSPRLLSGLAIEAFLLRTARFLDLASPVEASWVSREAAPGTRAVSNLYEARSPRRRRCSCPPAGSADFQARELASVRARTYGFIPQQRHRQRCRSGTVAALIPGAHQVPVRAMAALCGSDKGVTKRRRVLTDADNAARLRREGEAGFREFAFRGAPLWPAGSGPSLWLRAFVVRKAKSLAFRCLWQPLLTPYRWGDWQFQRRPSSCSNRGYS